MDSVILKGMVGIPITAVANSVSAVIATGIAAVIFMRMRTAAEQDLVRRDFFIAFLLVATLMWVFSTPGIVFTDVSQASYVPRVGGFLLLLASAFMFVVPIQLAGAGVSARRLVLGLFFVIAVTLLFLDFSTLEYSHIEQHGNFIVYHPHQNPIVRTLYGVLAMIVTISVGVFFLMHARSIAGDKERNIRRRAFLLGAGLLVLACSLALNYIVFSILFDSMLLLASSGIALFGMVLIGAGLALHPGE